MQNNFLEYSPTMRGQVQPTGYTVIGNGAVVTVFDRTEGAKPNLQYCRIQNVGTGAVKVCINDTATALKYNVILAADTASGAGNGGVVEIPGTWVVDKITCYGSAASELAFILVTCVGNERILNS